MAASIMSTPSSSATSLQRRLPSTPAGLPPRPRTETPSPGSWRHPRFTEITQRTASSVFDDANARQLLWNVSALAGLWLLASAVQDIAHSMHATTGNAVTLVSFTAHIVLLVNIVRNLLPLLRKKDNLNDIDLDASQRALLGLDPNATPPPSSATRYVTPPQYTYATTPHSTPGSRSSGATRTPPSRWESPSVVPTGIPTASPNASPLWSKAVGNGASRRHSSGLSTELTSSSISRDGGLPANSLSPINRSSVPITSRWIYEKGRSPGSRRSSMTGF